MPRAQSAVAFILPEQASETSRLDRVFFALADTTRRDILRRLRQEPLQVSSIAEAYAVSTQAVSRHIQVLVRAGLVRQERSGRISACSLDAGPLYEAAVWINDYSYYWKAQFDALKNWLEQDEDKQVRAERGRSVRPAQKRRRTRHAI
jgi:DNA-binding transcriptional ArsR family regulator